MTMQLFARQPTTSNPKWSPGRTKLDCLRFTLQDALCSVLDEIHAAGAELDLSRLITAQNALDERLDRYLDEVDPPSECGPGGDEIADDASPALKEGVEADYVEIWLRLAGGMAAPLCTMDLAAFEAATGGEVWTRLTDGERVFMGREELHAYFSVDTYGWGASLKGGVLSDHELRGAIE